MPWSRKFLQKINTLSNSSLKTSVLAIVASIKNPNQADYARIGAMLKPTKSKRTKNKRAEDHLRGAYPNRNRQLGAPPHPLAIRAERAPAV